MKNEYDYLNDVKMDFSIYDDVVLTEEEVYKMSETKKNNKSIKKRIIVTGVAAVLAVATGVAASEGYIDGIIKTITTGHSTFIEIDPRAPHSLPEELTGKLYDKYGNVITAITDEDIKGNIYDKNGKLLSEEQLMKLFNDALGDKVNVSEENSEDKAIWNTVQEAQGFVDFNIKYPEYLPGGFTFDNAYAYKDDKGNISRYYMTLDYKNNEGKIFSIHERLLNDETAFEMSTESKLEEMILNGRKTVIAGDKTAEFETDDSVSVTITTKGNVSKDELIKIAESIK